MQGHHLLSWEYYVLDDVSVVSLFSGCSISSGLFVALISTIVFWNLFVFFPGLPSSGLLVEAFHLVVPLFCLSSCSMLPIFCCLGVLTLVFSA